MVSQIQEPGPTVGTEPCVWLGSLPWTNITQPNLGLAILKSVLADEGISARVEHLNLEMLRFLREGTYVGLAQIWALNDYVFTGNLDAQPVGNRRRLVKETIAELWWSPTYNNGDVKDLDAVTAGIDKLRDETVPAWLEETADRLAAEPFTLYGMTCVFDQTFASIALGKALKARSPDRLIALGGYAVRSPTAEMLIRAFPWIDAVCIDEGEPVITGLARASVGQIALDEVPGLVIRDEAGAPKRTADAERWQMDSIPIPDYTDWFEDLKRLSRDHLLDISTFGMPVENSRGCWWGAKKHCIFCGIYDSDLAYRQKSPERALEQLDVLSERWGEKRFRFADYILPNSYYNTLIPALSKRDYSLACEIKANVQGDKLQLLADAGFVDVQPGIESFSSEILRLMDKGVRSTRCVYLMRVGRAVGIKVFYNLLHSFPGEGFEPYERMLRMVPRLRHLDSPMSKIPVQITRGAPLQVAPERWGLPVSDPEPRYDILLSEDYVTANGFSAADYAYYFNRVHHVPEKLRSLHRRLAVELQAWTRMDEQQTATLVRSGEDGGRRIQDGRFGDPVAHDLSELEAALLDLMDEPVPLESVRAEARGGSLEAIDGALARLDELGLYFEDEGDVVALPLPEARGVNTAGWMKTQIGEQN